MNAAKIKLEIPQGRTFSHVLRWGQPRLAYRQIAAVAQSAPCVLTTSTEHDIPDGWLFRIDNARGMTELNSVQFDEADPRLYSATVLTPDTIEINDLNAAGFPPYTGGGILVYNLPVDLDAIESAAAQFRARVDSTEILLSLTTENGGIVLDNVTKTITLQASAVDTAAITWLDAVWDLEATFASGTVLAVAHGSAVVLLEVTR